MFPALLAPVAAAVMALSPAHTQDNPYHSYTVRNGDTLSVIAQRTLGTARSWPKLWWKNRKTVNNPNSIAKGERLAIPLLARTWPYQRKAALAAIPPPPKPPKVTTAAPASGGDPPPAAPAQVASPTVAASGFEQCVITRESGGNPAAFNPSSGAGGLFQFLPSTWASLGFAGAYPGGAQTAPVSVQEAAFNKLYAEAGTSPWAPYDGC